MLGTLPLVALGGAIGASLRYLAGVGVVRAFGHTGFPLGVIGVNVLGSFLMGLFVSTAALKGWGHWNPFVATKKTGIVPIGSMTAHNAIKSLIIVSIITGPVLFVSTRRRLRPAFF